MIIVRIRREYVCRSGMRNSNSNNLSTTELLGSANPAGISIEPIRLKIRPIFRYSLVKTIKGRNSREITVFPESLLLQIH